MTTALAQAQGRRCPFVFQGGNVPAAAKLVCLHAGAKPKYPVCFLTNGGGVTEAQKAEQLSGWLDVAVGVDQVVDKLDSHCTAQQHHFITFAACANLVRAVASFALQQWQVLQANIPMTSFNSACFINLMSSKTKIRCL